MEVVCVTECHEGTVSRQDEHVRNFVYELDNSPAWEIPSVKKIIKLVDLILRLSSQW